MSLLTHAATTTVRMPSALMCEFMSIRSLSIVTEIQSYFCNYYDSHPYFMASSDPAQYSYDSHSRPHIALIEVIIFATIDLG